LCGLDFIYDSWTVRAENSILIHGGSLKKVIVRSIKGRKFEKSILEKSQSKLEKCRINIQDCLRSVFLVMDIWKTHSEDQPEKSESTIVLKLVRARLCADMDSEQFLWEEVPLWKRAKFTLEASSGLRVARKLIGKYECNKIVVFNGREPLEAAFIEVGRSHGIPVQIIERGADATRYEVYNKSPHLSAEWWEKISNCFHRYHTMLEALAVKWWRVKLRKFLLPQVGIQKLKPINSCFQRPLLEPWK
jgi:hypothetical protein